MSLRVVIDGEDRSAHVSGVSLVLGTTKEATTGSFVVDAYGAKWRPEGEEEVVVWWDERDPDTQEILTSTKIFGGFLVRFERQTFQGHVVRYACTLKNYVHLLDRKNVNQAYAEQTAKEIIDDIVANYAGAGITTTGVDAAVSLEVAAISFNNIPPSEAIQKLADQLGYEWYVDEDKDIRFFAKLTETAPFGLDDTAGNHVFESLKIAQDFTQIRNSVLVEGGEELSTAAETDTFEADGVQYTFNLSRKYSGLAVTVDGTPQTVGIQNIDSFTSHDCLYDFNLRTLYFDPASPPGAGLEIVVTAEYYFPIVVRYRELTSIGLFGEREVFIQAPDIKSRTDAADRALAELTAYARQLKEGSFETYRQGLTPGQRITIASDVDAFSADFVIQRMRGTLVSPERMRWTVDVVSVKTYELIDLLSQIIRNGRVASPTDPVIVTAERVMRDILVDRTITVRAAIEIDRAVEIARDTRTYIDDPPTWVVGPYHPTSIDDRKRPLFADRGCLLE